jgi:(1->4)-alpha-D-glucan 1-alpha-D-glucosylmutase
MSSFRIPTATYRIQFNLHFRYADARDLVPYLHELGISDLYASPHFKAKRGSSHGYDTADPQRISSELGTEEEFEELVQKLKHYGMGLLLDIVPNHMSASSDDPWWMDVLENGPSSAYSNYFDIDWHPATTKAAFLQENKVLLPLLGDLYGNVLENQELALKLDENGLFIRYGEHRFPLDPKSYAPIVQQILEDIRASRSASAGAVHDLSAVMEWIRLLPHYTSTSPEEREQRQINAKRMKESLWRIYLGDPDATRIFDEILRRINGKREDHTSFNQLDQILDVQPYRLAHWKIGLEEINYRRFSDVNELIGLRVEDPVVFANQHAQILQLVQKGRVTGLRVDHVDGLYDPLGYLQLLQRSLGSGNGDSPAQNLYIVVEKILGERESLPEEWPVCGTTGYDFLNAVNALFVDPQGLAALEQIYTRFTGSTASFAEVSCAGNRKVMEQLFAGEVHALIHHLGKLAAQNRRARDLPLYELEQLLIEVTACLPVYRTYMRDSRVSPRDRAFLNRALEIARSRTPRSNVSDAAFAYLHRVLFLDPPFYGQGREAEFLRFVMRWQQFTGPVMAKGLEDTAFYVHNSLVSMNEVGGDPLREALPLDVQAFHLFNQERQARWPHTLNATSTHDTKRGEDVRARVNVLAELPDEWAACLGRWSRWNQVKKKVVGNHVAPSPNEEVLLYQTMLGAWPLQAEEVPAFVDRLKTYMVKASREAKIHTDWINPNPAHESALERFVESVLDSTQKNRFLTDLLRFQEKIAYYAAWGGLSQTLLKATSPGLPDFYQGTELWDFNLVDPDNRRPVDFQKRVRMLEFLKEQEPKDLAQVARELVDRWQDGRIKLYLTWKALEFRRLHHTLFQRGDYVSLSAAGKYAENVCAFARRQGSSWIVVAVPRLLSRLVDPGEPPIGRAVWGPGNLVLPRSAPASWRNVLTGETTTARSTGRIRTIRLENVFHSFPVALLEGTGP